MGDTTTTVNVEAEKPAPRIVSRGPSPMMRAWLRFEKLFLSTKVWGTAICCWYLWADHWADAEYIVAMTDPAQLQAFVTITVNKNDTMKWVILGFLGFSTAGGIAGAAMSGANVVSRFTQTATSRFDDDGIKNRNSKADRDE